MTLDVGKLLSYEEENAYNPRRLVSPLGLESEGSNLHTLTVRT
jgi:hypothetical protein